MQPTIIDKIALNLSVLSAEVQFFFKETKKYNIILPRHTDCYAEEESDRVHTE